MLLCYVLGRAGQPAAQLSENALVADSTSITLESLQPDTEYVISLYPLFPRNSASPSILNARTCKFTKMGAFPYVWGSRARPVSLRLPFCCCFCLCLLVLVRLEAVQQLSVKTLSEGSVYVRWRGVSGVKGYRLICGPLRGQQAGRRQPCCALFEYARCSIVCVFMIQKGNIVETVDLAGDTEAYTLSGLQPNTDYIVTVLTLYEGNVEGPVATAAFNIGRLIFFFLHPQFELSPESWSRDKQWQHFL